MNGDIQEVVLHIRQDRLGYAMITNPEISVASHSKI